MKIKNYFILYSLSILVVSLSGNIYAIPGVVTVTSTNDSGPGSLRQAISDVNNDATMPHIITFSLGSGVKTIQLASALPVLTASYTFIDGSTAASWSLNNPVIVLDGSLLTPGSADGIVLSGIHNCVIRGLVINNGFNNGILITDGNIGSTNNAIIGCFIGTNQTGDAAAGNVNGIAIIGSTDFSNDMNKIGSDTEINVISGNSNYGIVASTNVNNSFIQNNYIGTDHTGIISIANGAGGIALTGSTIPTLDEQCIGNFIFFNLISGNGGPGITLNANCFGTIIQGNYIGVDSTGVAALPNVIGIFVQGMIPTDSSDPTNGSISDTYISNENITSGNSSHGIYLNTNVGNTSIYSNAVGTDITGALDLGNGGNGIYILGALNAPCSANKIGFAQQPNYIKFNGNGLSAHYGVLIDGDASTPSLYNAIVENNIFDNDSDGIKLLNMSNNESSSTNYSERGIK